jgi:hypothetical protein
MTLVLNGTTGVSAVDGSASTPAIQGSDSNTGMFFPAADTIAFAEGGTEVVRIDSAGNVGLAVNGTAFQWNSAGNNCYIAGNSGVMSFATGTGGYVERARIDASGNFLFNSGYGSAAVAYGCRAWVNFNGTGTIAIRASGNVSSITDNGTGDYTVNFTTAMPDANFSGVAFNMDGGSGYRNYFTIGNGYTTTTFRFIIITPSSVYADPSTLGVAIFR